MDMAKLECAEAPILIWGGQGTKQLLDKVKGLETAEDAEALESGSQGMSEVQDGFGGDEVGGDLEGGKGMEKRVGVEGGGDPVMQGPGIWSSGVEVVVVCCGEPQRGEGGTVGVEKGGEGMGVTEMGFLKRQSEGQGIEGVERRKVGEKGAEVDELARLDGEETEVGRQGGQ